MSDDKAYCYHCRAHHPKEEMRLVVGKAGKRWRCIKSIEATKVSTAERDAYGKKVTEANSAEQKSRMRLMRDK